jgi:hypothetical protein
MISSIFNPGLPKIMIMKAIKNRSALLMMLLILAGNGAISGICSIGKDDVLIRKMETSVEAFLKTLTAEQKVVAAVAYDDAARFDWHFIPRTRKGLAIKNMNAEQRLAAMAMIKVVLSAEGNTKVEQIMDLENVLRVLETRPANDVYRDPENFSFMVFGAPGKAPWGWRVEGHHLSLHFSLVNGQISFTPGFLGSNPGVVLIDVPQKGRRILKEEEDFAFDLLNALNKDQLHKVILKSEAPHEIFTSNSRKASLEKREGLPMAEMSKQQAALFKKLIMVYLQRYHVTLKKQQWAQLEKDGLGEIYFAWMGEQTAEIGKGHGHYYRIHGPGFLVEFDNTQNGGNHIHSVVRDLRNDFGDDLLRMHYEKAHR